MVDTAVRDTGLVTETDSDIRNKYNWIDNLILDKQVYVLLIKLVLVETAPRER